MANKPPQVLILTPSDGITFEGPFNRVVTSYLELRNPSYKRVCFKVKTTAPRRYCVRPNSGLIEPNMNVRISIMLQPIEDENKDERMRHKFMVQSTFVDDVGEIKIDKVWESATQVMDSKLKCVFEDGLSDVDPSDVNPSDVKAKEAEEPHVPDVVNSTKTTTTTNATSATEATTKASNEPNRYTQGPERAYDEATKKAFVDPCHSPTKSTIATDKETSRQKTDAHFPTPLTSTPSASGSVGTSRQFLKRVELTEANKSMASASSLTSSFLQPISDDYKMVLVCLAMLFIGVILGKYIM